MPQLTVVYWRDIPAQVIAKAGRTAAKRQLTERFEKAIDRAAMRAGLRDTDSYLAEWRRTDPVECGADLEAEAAAAAARLEAEFTDERLTQLVAQGGKAGA
jgi:Virulence factor